MDQRGGRRDRRGDQDAESGHRGGAGSIFQALRFIRESPKAAHAIAATTLGWPEDAVARADEITGPLFSRDGTISVEAIEAMQTTMLELKAQKQRMPASDLSTTEFTPIRLSSLRGGLGRLSRRVRPALDERLRPRWRRRPDAPAGRD